MTTKTCIGEINRIATMANDIKRLTCERCERDSTHKFCSCNKDCWIVSMMVENVLFAEMNGYECGSVTTPFEKELTMMDSALYAITEQLKEMKRSRNKMDRTQAVENAFYSGKVSAYNTILKIVLGIKNNAVKKHLKDNK